MAQCTSQNCVPDAVGFLRTYSSPKGECRVLYFARHTQRAPEGPRGLGVAPQAQRGGEVLSDVAGKRVHPRRVLAP